MSRALLPEFPVALMRDAAAHRFVRRVAHHEGGHAVALWFFGHRPARALVVRKGDPPPKALRNGGLMDLHGCVEVPRIGQPHSRRR